MKDAGGSVTAMSYDAAGNMTAIEQPPVGGTSNITRFRYDTLNRQVRKTDTFGKSNVFEYDAADRLRREIDRNGRVRVFDYDELNRLIAERWYQNVAGQVPFYTSDLRYDATGNLRLAQDTSSKYEKEYDLLNRAVSQTYDRGPTDPATNRLDYTYNALDQRVKVVDSKGGTTTWIYDKLGRLAREVFKAGNQELAVDQSWTPRDQLDSKYYFNNLDTIRPVLITGFTYDELERTKTEITTKEFQPFEILLHDYDSADRMIKDSRTPYLANGQPDPDTRFKYDVAPKYDDVDQLKTDGNRTFTYDAAHNREERDAQGQLITRVGQGNRLLEDKDWKYDYDAEGNLKTKTAKVGAKQWSYFYDHANRLIRVVEGTVNNNTDFDTITAYSYDIFGNLISRRFMLSSGLETVDTYLYDGHTVWADFRDNVPFNRYIRGDLPNQFFARFDLGGGRGLLWYVTNRQNSVIDLVNRQGDIVERLQYAGFGTSAFRRRARGNVAEDRYEYLGRFTDPYTGLSLAGSQWYDPATGHWISENENAYASGDVNLYRFESNNPLQAEMTEAERARADAIALKNAVFSLQDDIASAGARVANAVWNYTGGLAWDLVENEVTSRRLDGEFRDIAAKKGQAPPAPSPSPTLAAASAGGEGLGHGGAIVANTFTFGVITPLDRHVEGVVAENGGLYHASQISATVAREALITAATLGAGSLARAGQVGAFGMTYRAGSGVQAAAQVRSIFLAGRDAWQAGKSLGEAYNAYQAGDAFGVGLNLAFAGLGALGTIGGAKDALTGIRQHAQAMREMRRIRQLMWEVSPEGRAARIQEA